MVLILISWYTLAMVGMFVAALGMAIGAAGATGVWYTPSDESLTKNEMVTRQAISATAFARIRR